MLHVDDDSDQIRETLREHFLAAARPRSIIRWLQSQQVRHLLAGIADGSIAATHEALDDLPQTATLRHIRALLIDRGHLPPQDAALARFAAWIPTKIDTIESPDSRDALRRFATWHHLRKVRDCAALPRGAASAAHNAKQEITVASNFLKWLADRSSTLRSCSQSDIDDWLADGPTTRYTVKNFLTFTAQSQLSPALTVPRRTVKTIRRIDAEERLVWIRRCLEAEQYPAAPRLIALLLLVFGQPITRIAAMPITAVDVDDSTARIRFVDDWIDLPAPIAALLTQHLANRAPTSTRTVDTNPYLFPGARPGEHVHRHSIKLALNRLGIDLLGSKNTALDELVASMPAPMVADALGFSYNAMAQHEGFKGLRFERYVSGRYPG
ncbi:hypothetical protein [Gryllotalpicola koreensis]